MSAGTKAIISVLTVALIGTALFCFIRIGSLSEKLEVASKELTAAQLAFEFLTRERDELIARCDSYDNEILRLRAQSSEIHRLRAELNRAAREARESEMLDKTAEQLEEAALETLDTFAARIVVMREAIRTAPSESIPEFALLTERDWIEAAASFNELTEEPLPTALRHLRALAKNRLSDRLMRGLKAYVEASQGQLPGSMEDLLLFLPPDVETGMLQRYELVETGAAQDLRTGQSVIEEIKDVHADRETYFRVGMDGYGFQRPDNQGAPFTIGAWFSPE